MKKVNLIISIAVALVFSINGAVAQEGLETGNLEVVKEFEVKLQETNLVDIPPVIQPVIPIKKSYDYQITIVPLSLDYPAPVLKPLAMSDQNDFEQYNHYIKASYGTIANPEGIMRLGFKGGDKYGIVFDGKYWSAKNPKIDFQEFTDTEVGLTGFARLSENVVLNYDVDGNYENRYFYDIKKPVSTGFYGQKRNVLGGTAKVGIANIDKYRGGLNYSLNSKLITDRVTSPNLDARVGLGFGLEGSIEKRSSDHVNIVVPLNAVTYTTNAKVDNNANLILAVDPHVHFQWGRFQAIAGINFYNDTQLKSKVWPLVELGVGIIGNYVQAVAGTKQDYRLNSLDAQYTFMPWVFDTNLPVNSTVWQTYYGGLRGELNFLSYQVEVGYKEATQEMFGVNEIVNGNNELRLTFDNFKSPFVTGTVDFTFSSKINIGGKLSKYFYSNETLEVPFGLPSLELNGYMIWDIIKDKLSLKSNLFITDRVQTYSYEFGSNTGIKNLNNQVELDTELEFWPSKYFGLHGYARNLLNNEYQRWDGYPVYGIHFGGGLQVKF